MLNAFSYVSGQLYQEASLQLKLLLEKEVQLSEENEKIKMEHARELEECKRHYSSQFQISMQQKDGAHSSELSKLNAALQGHTLNE